jgi:EmrB/QacA subfamily drug resistance transporter
MFLFLIKRVFQFFKSSLIDCIMRTIEYKWIALSCTSIGAFFSIFDGSALVIALPSIMLELHASFTIVLWIMMSYLLIITVFVPAIGRVADIIGRKKLFVEGFAIFTIGSFLSGSSINGEMLIVFRIVQAFGAVLLITNSTAIVTDAFPKKELGKALGINGMVISIGAVAGPIIGGALTMISWRYIFYVNVPVGILGTFWAQKNLQKIYVRPVNQTFDWKGTILFISGMIILLLGCSFGAFLGWINPFIIMSFILSVFLLALFIWLENSTQQPMLDLRLFKTRILGFALISNLMNGIARGAITFLLVLFFQGIQNYDPLMAGILLTPFAATMMIVAPLSGRMSDKYGSRGLSTAGLIISAIGLIGFFLIEPKTSILTSIIWLIIMGIGSGMFFSPNTNTIMSAVPPEKRGVASGTRTMMMNLGSIISLAITMAVITSSMTSAALQGLFTGTQVGSKGINIILFMYGLHYVFFISFIISLIGAFLSYLRGPVPTWDKIPSTKSVNEVI